MITEQDLLDNDFFIFGIEEWIGVKYFQKIDSPFSYRIALHNGKAKRLTLIWDIGYPTAKIAKMSNKDLLEYTDKDFFMFLYDDEEFSSIDEINKDWASMYKEGEFCLFGDPDLPFSFENIPDHVNELLKKL